MVTTFAMTTSALLTAMRSAGGEVSFDKSSHLRMMRMEQQCRTWAETEGDENMVIPVFGIQRLWIEKTAAPVGSDHQLLAQEAESDRMPLYDTLTLGGDKQPVVFEFGFAYTRSVISALHSGIHVIE